MGAGSFVVIVIIMMIIVVILNLPTIITISINRDIISRSVKSESAPLLEIK